MKVYACCLDVFESSGSHGPNKISTYVQAQACSWVLCWTGSLKMKLRNILDVI